MGNLFKYIADEIIDLVESRSCPRCQYKRPLFPIDATPELEEWDVYGDRVEELCSICFRNIPLRKLQPRDQEMRIQQMINQHYPKGSLRGDERLSKFIGICDEFRRTPTIPLFLQNEDRPFCCGDFAEFIGEPKSYKESIQIAKELTLWDRKFIDYEELYGDMTLEPESLREISLFLCHGCNKRIYTWQCT